MSQHSPQRRVHGTKQCVVPVIHTDRRGSNSVPLLDGTMEFLFLVPPILIQMYLKNIRYHEICLISFLDCSFSTLYIPTMKNKEMHYLTFIKWMCGIYGSHT
jgi:hypothetical protein